MCVNRSETNDGEFFSGRTATTALAAAYVTVGIGFWIGLLMGWFRLLVAALGGTAVLVVVSLYIAVRREGLVTAENALFAAFALVATGLLLSLSAFTDVSSEFVFPLCFAVAGLPPYLILKYTGYGKPT
ncbi:hypothetical protein [Haloterrigena salinisoli]|uniref:hypothetical protein n=1 Tax=Haloterrigena salinisoli TaxID=3132747 RepID=UPI0030CC26B7